MPLGRQDDPSSGYGRQFCYNRQTSAGTFLIVGRTCPVSEHFYSDATDWGFARATTRFMLNTNFGDSHSRRRIRNAVEEEGSRRLVNQSDSPLYHNHDNTALAAVP